MLLVVCVYFLVDIEVFVLCGGYFLWIELLLYMDVMYLFDDVMESGVSIVFGLIFFVIGGFCCYLWFNYGWLWILVVECVLEMFGMFVFW